MVKSELSSRSGSVKNQNGLILHWWKEFFGGGKDLSTLCNRIII